MEELLTIMTACLPIFQFFFLGMVVFLAFVRIFYICYKNLSFIPLHPLFSFIIFTIVRILILDQISEDLMKIYNFYF